VNRFSVVGLSHKSAPTAVREKLQAAESEAVLEAARGLAPEVVVVSTCNRFEVYSHAAGDPAETLDWLAERADLDAKTLREHAFALQGRNACKHLFFVCASLDSLVVGETQIRGQVKRAYKAAQDAGTVGPYLNRLFQSALRVSKEIAETTGVGRGTVSVAGAASDLAERIFGNLETARVLVLGAGETADLLVHNLRGRGVSQFCILNRTAEHARQLAERCGGESGGLDELSARLRDADIVAAAAGGDQPLLTRAVMREAVRARRGRPMVALDIAVPRAIDPSVDSLDNVYRYDMDALSEVTQDALRQRRRDFLQCCNLIDGAVLRLEAGARAGEAAPAIVAVERSYREAAQITIDEIRRKIPELDAHGHDAVQRSIQRLVGRLLHLPVRALRDGDEHARETLRRAFVPPDDEGGSDEG